MLQWGRDVSVADAAFDADLILYCFSWASSSTPSLTEQNEAKSKAEDSKSPFRDNRAPLLKDQVIRALDVVR